MKNVILLLSLILVCYSCEGKTKTNEKGKFTISGISSNSEYNNNYIYLIKDIFVSGGDEAIDSALIQSNKFYFEGIVEAPTVYTMVFKLPNENRQIWNSLLLEKGDINAMIADNYISISGTPSNDAYRANRDSLVSLHKSLDNAFQELKGTPLEVREQSDALHQKFMKQSSEINIDYVKKNPNDPLAQKVMCDSYRIWPVKELGTVLGLIPDSVKSKSLFKSVLKTYESMKNVEIGKKYIDMKSVDINGKEISLSDYVGKAKYTILDFWSPGCDICKAELEILSEAYKLYKNQGLEIIGISLDCDKERWTNISKENKITWPQMLSGICNNGENSADIYAIANIPYVFILDKDGIIIEKNLKGKNLLKKLDELMNK